MKYLMIHAVDQDATPNDPTCATPEALDSWVQEMLTRGVLLDGARLRPVSDATTVRAPGGTAVVTDGPFAETKEALAGFYLIDARDLNEAIQLASKIPPAQYGSIEIRPTRELVVDEDDVARYAAAAAP
jgi:hypothetical protein